MQKGLVVVEKERKKKRKRKDRQRGLVNKRCLFVHRQFSEKAFHI